MGGGRDRRTARRAAGGTRDPPARRRRAAPASGAATPAREAAQLAPPLPHPRPTRRNGRSMTPHICTGRPRAPTPAYPAAASPQLFTPLRLTSASSPHPCPSSTVGPRAEVRASSRPPPSALRQPTRKRRERKPRPLRSVSRPQAPPPPLPSCFGLPRGGAWEETHSGSAGRPEHRT